MQTLFWTKVTVIINSSTLFLIYQRTYLIYSTYDKSINISGATTKLHQSKRVGFCFLIAGGII